MNSYINIFLLFFLNTYLYAQHPIEYDYELDAYYSNVSAFIDLDSDNEITDATEYSEAKIYTNLILNSLTPNIFLVEAAVHPMPIFGLYFRDSHEEMYDKSNIQNLNLVKAITAGFEEPYSVSFFVGRMMIFKNREIDSERIGKNRAFIGYLMSIGGSSIKDNFTHKDRWINFEFKLKGTREKKNRDLDWSFRVGIMLHSNKDFVNSIYFGARRSSIDYKKGVWSLLYNSAFSTMLAISSRTYKLTEAELIVEKKWPIQWSDKMSFGLGLGYLYNSGEKYAGILRDEGIDNHQLIFRPNLKW